MDEEPIDEAIEPDDAFAILSDANRIEILRALWRADDHEAGFSELHDAVDVADSGQFNYHLDELVGQFVRKTEDGYALRAPGARVVAAVLAGAYTMEPSTTDRSLDEPCPTCGEAMGFRYDGEYARFECAACGPIVQYPVPPGTFADVEPDAIPDRTLQYLRALGAQLRNDLCPHCEGRVGATVVRRDHPYATDSTDVLPAVEYDCVRCSATFNADLGTPFLDHPAVVSFYHDRGIDVREAPIWQFGAFEPERVSIRADDPLCAAVTYEADGDALTLVVDGDVDVRSVERP